jgi:hypothetical protein
MIVRNGKNYRGCWSGRTDSNRRPAWEALPAQSSPTYCEVLRNLLIRNSLFAGRFWDGEGKWGCAKSLKKWYAGVDSTHRPFAPEANVHASSALFSFALSRSQRPYLGPIAAKWVGIWVSEGDAKAQAPVLLMSERVAFLGWSAILEAKLPERRERYV